MQVIDLVLAYEGDVMKFAGDSMIVAFYPKEEELTAGDLGLRSSTLRAAHCSSDLVQKYGEQQGMGRMLQPADMLLQTVFPVRSSRSIVWPAWPSLQVRGAGP